VLVKRENGFTRAIQKVGPEQVADELGILPSDEIVGVFCVFVEGPADVFSLVKSQIVQCRKNFI